MENNINVVSGEPVKKKRKYLFIFAGVLLAILVMIVAYVGVFHYSEWGKKRILFKACANTFQMDELMTSIAQTNIGEDNKFKLEVRMDYEGMEIKAQRNADFLEKEEYITFEIADEDLELEAQMWLNNEDIELYIPKVYDKKFVYNYNETHEGYIFDLAEALEVNLDDLDSSLRMMFPDIDEMETSQISDEELATKILSIMNEMNIERMSSKKCRVNDKMRRCKGYKTVLTKEDIKELLDVYEEIYAVSSSSGTALFLGSKEGELTEQFDAMREDIKDMEDIDVSLYIYRDQIAEIILETEETTVDMEIFGGNKPLDNYLVAFDFDGETFTIEKEGETRGNEHLAEYMFDDENVIEYTYDDDLGNYELVLFGENGRYDLEGGIEVKDDEIYVCIDKIRANKENLDITAEISLSNDCKLKKAESGVDVFNLGRASDEDWETLIYDLVFELGVYM